MVSFLQPVNVGILIVFLIIQVQIICSTEHVNAFSVYIYIYVLSELIDQLTFSSRIKLRAAGQKVISEK
jgi:hypothetical protein